MLYNKQELQQKGFFPKGKYNFGGIFPEGFKLPEIISNEDFKKIPLYVKIHYEYYPTNGVHKLNSTN